MIFEKKNINNGKIIKLFSIVFVFVAMFAILSSFTTEVYATDFYVNDSTGSDTSLSGDIVNPYKSIEKAVNETNAGGGNDKIIIDSGIYRNSDNIGIDINQNVSIYGAKYFDSSKAETIIDAEGTGVIFTISAGTVNLYGITFTNGTRVSGGAIFSKAIVNIYNCTFTDNIATGTGNNEGGAAIYQEGDTTFLNVVNSTFKNNKADGRGGAILKRGSGLLIISDSIFQNNRADIEGGAIYSAGRGELSLKNSTFYNNSALRGGALYNRGNGDFLHIINNCIFISNVANEGSAIFKFASDSGVNISYSLFINNSGYQVYSSLGDFILADYNWWGSNSVTGKYYGFDLNNYFVAVLKGNNQIAHISKFYEYSYFLALNGTNAYNSNAANLPNFEVTITHPNGTTQTLSAKNYYSWTYAFPNYNPIIVSSSVHNQNLNLKSTVEIVPTSLSVSSFSSFYGKTTLLKATLNTKTSFAVGKTINFYLNGIYIGNGKVDSNGIATLSYKSNYVGKKTFTAKFNGGLTNLASNSATGAVTKSKVTSSITKFVGKFNKKGYIKVTLKDQNKKVLAKKTVKFYIKGKYVGKAKTNNKGVATLNLKKVKFKGKVSVVAKFNTDAFYASSKTTKKVKIKR